MVLAAGCTPQIRFTRPERAGQQTEKAEKPSPYQPPPASIQRAGKKGSQKLLEEVVNSYIGVPYKWGGTTSSGFDCSGFVLTVFREVYDINLPRSSGSMWKKGRRIAMPAARPGDLVFFQGSNFSDIGHVGIYMGNNRFVHASTSSGIIYTDLKESYYARRFVGVRRMQ